MSTIVPVNIRYIQKNRSKISVGNNDDLCYSSLMMISFINPERFHGVYPLASQLFLWPCSVAKSKLFVSSMVQWFVVFLGKSRGTMVLRTSDIGAFL